MPLYLGRQKIDFIPVGYRGGGIDTSDATAIAANIQAGYSAYVNGNKIIGTLSPLPEQIVEGFTIAGVTGTFKGLETADATAEVSHILAGKTAYVNGEKITGTITSKGAATYTPTTSNQTIAAGQYLSGAQTIAGDADLIAANIKTGVNIFGVTGTFTSDANATAAQILSGKTAYVNGSKITGTIASKAAATYYATTADQTIAAGQYLSGVQTIKKLTASNLSAENIKTGVTVTVNNGNANVYSVAGTFTSDGTAVAAQILRGYVAYSKGTKYTGTLPNYGYGTSLPSSATNGDMYFLVSGGVLQTGNQVINASTSSYAENFSIGSLSYSYTQTTGFNNSTFTFNSNGTVTYSIPWIRSVSDNCTWNLTYTIQWTPPGGSAANIVSSTLSSISTSGTISGTATPTVSSTAGTGTLKITLVFKNTRTGGSYTYTGTTTIGVGKLYARYLRSSGSWVKQI